MHTNKLLVVCAHPDDEVLGCGGTVAKLVKEGYEAHVLILGEGITSRDETRIRGKRKNNIQELKRQALKANKIIGVKNIVTCDYPDNRFDRVDLLDIVKTIEKVKNKVKPHIVFTHYGRDLNIDHRMVYQAVLTATRPSCKESVKGIYSFEIVSSTEWNYPLSFSPDMFFDISETLDVKLNALKEYHREITYDGSLRSLKGIELSAQYWGASVGLKYAEAFKVVRIIR